MLKILQQTQLMAWKFKQQSQFLGIHCLLCIYPNKTFLVLVTYGGATYKVKNRKQTFTDGVSNLYAEAIEVAGLWDSSEASSRSSQSWSSSSSCFSFWLIRRGCARPFSESGCPIYCENNTKSWSFHKLWNYLLKFHLSINIIFYHIYSNKYQISK